MVKPSKGTLYIVACAAGPAKYIGHLVTEAMSRGWIVRVLPTPNAMDWLPLDELEKQTGFTLRPVVSSSLPAARKAPPPDAIIVAPASFNTINKLALGISDNKALDTICPLISTKIPFVILPFTNQRYYARAPLRRSVSALRREGVSVLLRPPPNDMSIWESALALLEKSPKGFCPHPAGTGEGIEYPWFDALDEVERIQSKGEGGSHIPLALGLGTIIAGLLAYQRARL